MSVIFRITKVTPEMVNAVTLATKLILERTNIFTCVSIDDAYETVASKEEYTENIDNLLADYGDYVLERVFPNRVEPIHTNPKEETAEQQFNRLFRTWENPQERLTARLTALRQFANNLKHRLENQQ